MIGKGVLPQVVVQRRYTAVELCKFVARLQRNRGSMTLSFSIKIPGLSEKLPERGDLARGSIQCRAKLLPLGGRDREVDLVGQNLLGCTAGMIHHEAAQGGLLELGGPSNQVLLCRMQANLNLCFFECRGGSHCDFRSQNFLTFPRKQAEWTLSIRPRTARHQG